MGYIPQSEKNLVSDLMAGNEAAFSWLVDQYHGQLQRLARMFVSSDAVADEVVQETWLAVLKGLARFEGRSSLKTWIFRILKNRAKTRGVRESRTTPFSSFSPGEEEVTVEPERFTAAGSWAEPPDKWAQDMPDRIVQDQQARKLIEAAIAELPENQAAVITLRDIQGWSSPEICDYLGISEANQRVLLHRARSKLRRVLEKELRSK